MRLIKCAAMGLFSVMAFSVNAEESFHPLIVVVEPLCPSIAPPLHTQSFTGAVVIEALASRLIEVAVDTAGAYFTSAATTKSTALWGSVNQTFYELNSRGNLSPTNNGKGCIVMFVPGNSDRTPWFDAARKRSAVLGQQDKLPQFYFEASFEPATDSKNNIIVRNQFLHVSTFQQSGWSYRDDRSYSVAITARKREDGQPFGAVTFNFNNVRPGTRGESQVINIDAHDAKETDASIEATINPNASAQRVPFFPVSTEIEAAVSAQQVASAPYSKAERITNNVPDEPTMREPEWSVQTTPNSENVVQSFIGKLKSFCEQQAKLPKGTAKDARCPVAYLQASNDLEETRAALRKQLDAEWAKKFTSLHVAECARDGRGEMKCTPPSPKQTQFGTYVWEVAVVETSEPTALAKAVARLFADNKEKLKADLQNELIPSKREAAKQAEESAKNDALVAYKLAMLNVKQTEAKLAEAADQPRSSQIAIEAEVLRAQVAANLAARTAGLAVPFEN